jgi:hypothetical protein
MGNSYLDEISFGCELNPFKELDFTEDPKLIGQLKSFRRHTGILQ